LNGIDYQFPSFHFCTAGTLSICTEFIPVPNPTQSPSKLPLHNGWHFPIQIVSLDNPRLFLFFSVGFGQYYLLAQGTFPLLLSFWFLLLLRGDSITPCPFFENELVSSSLLRPFRSDPCFTSTCPRSYSSSVYGMFRGRACPPYVNAGPAVPVRFLLPRVEIICLSTLAEELISQNSCTQGSLKPANVSWGTLTSTVPSFFIR